MMTEEQQKIAEQILQAVQERLAQTDLTARLAEVPKNNGVELTGIVAGRDGLDSIVYINQEIQLILDGQATVEDVASSVAKTLETRAEKAPFTAKGVTDLLEHPDPAQISMRVVNREQNTEMLKTMLHRDIHGDLSIIASYKVAEDASTKITNDLAARMGFTATEVIDQAIRNANREEHSVRSMGEVLAESMGIPPEQAAVMFGTDDTMIVVTNDSKLYGAGDIFVDKALREHVAERIGGDYYIIPSSVHEVICVSADAMTPGQAAAMIQEVNANEVRPEEVLGTHPYHVDAQTLKISNPCEAQMERIADEMKHSIHM